jgi:hypothetical protein
MEDQVSIRAQVPPRFVRHQPEDEWPQMLARLPMTHVDHAAVVEIPVTGTVGVGRPVEPATHGQREPPVGVQQAAIVLAEPLSVRAHGVPVALGPEPAQVLRPLWTAGPVEPRQRRIVGDERQVRAVPGHRGRIVVGGTGEVERLCRRAPGGQADARQLQQPQGGRAAGGEEAPERAVGQVGVSAGTFQPPPGEQELGGRLCRGGYGFADRLQSGGVPAGVAESQGEGCEGQRRRDVIGIGVQRAELALRCTLESPHTHSTAQSERIGLLPGGSPRLGQSEQVPPDRPRRLELHRAAQVPPCEPGG